MNKNEITNENDKSIQQRWEKLGFLNGVNEEYKLTLAHNYEHMAIYLTSDGGIEDISKFEDENYEIGVFETIIFPIIRRITDEVHIPLHPKALTSLIFNTKYSDIKSYLNDNADKVEIEKLLTNDYFWSVFSKNNKSKIDSEAYVCAALSEYLIPILKKKQWFDI